MVLETPSFELAKEVWGVEINVLGRLSLEREEGRTPGMDPDQTLEKNEMKFAEEIKLAVERAKRHGQAKRTRTEKK